MLLQQLPRDFYPDFKKAPKKLETIHHDELGDIDFWRYEAKLGGRIIYWDYAVIKKTHEGWVRSIVYADSPPNKFGGMKEIIDSGFITSKPLDYKQQMTGVTDSEDAYWHGFISDSAHDSYKNILFIIGRMKFMQEFCRSDFFRKNYPGPKGTTDVDIPQMP